MAVVEVVQNTESGARRMRISSPVDAKRLGEFEAARPDAVSAAVDRARAVQPEWAALGFDGRARYLQNALALLVKQSDRLIDRIVLETGRSRLETLFLEILPACDSLNYYSKRAKKILRDRTIPLHLLRMKKCKLIYRPLGVVGVISPWNGPFILSLNPTVQALMAGNTVVIKPSEVTPFSGKLVGDLFLEAGMPKDIVQVVLGDGETGAALVNSGVDKISFTGSVATGRKVGEVCGRNLIPCSLELGGKDPLIVCSDADLERASSGAVFSAFLNNGQVCCGTERVYVVDKVADDFTRRVIEKTAALRVGGDGEFDIGPFIFEKQIEIVERHMKDAVEKGAKVLIGGKRRTQAGKYYYEPTVLSGVTHQMLIMREETFGPILPIVRCRGEDEAVRLANDSTYGLSATVWTRDKRRGERIAKQMEAGSVCINDSSITYGALEVPFGGVKQSGVGYVNGETGLKGCCHALPIIIDRFGMKSELVWYPYTAEKLNTLQRAVRFMWGLPFVRWLLS